MRKYLILTFLALLGVSGCAYANERAVWCVRGLSAVCGGYAAFKTVKLFIDAYRQERNLGRQISDMTKKLEDGTYQNQYEVLVAVENLKKEYNAKRKKRRYDMLKAGVSAVVGIGLWMIQKKLMPVAELIETSLIEPGVENDTHTWSDKIVDGLVSACKFLIGPGRDNAGSLRGQRSVQTLGDFIE